MNAMLRLAGLLALTLAGLTPAAAQGVPNLTGTWVLAVDKSDFGPMPPPQGRTDVIDHQEPALTIKRTIMTANGEVNSTFTYAVDGKPYKNTTAQGEVTSTLSWEGEVLVIVNTLDTPSGMVTLSDRISLSPDGKTLTHKRVISAQGQEVAQTMVLSKQ